MLNSPPNESELLTTILEILLEDFQYWFFRAQTLLESERITLLSPEEQDELLAKVNKSKQEVITAQILFKATDKKTGIDTAILVLWHKLVAECWQISMRWRSHKTNKT
ncbi:MAG: DUF2605 domain-containing protein [cyanobacterium endosymbiont of Rhopalodia yunnanensis]